MERLIVLSLLGLLAGAQDPSAAALERWRGGTEEERLQALRDAAAHRKDWGEAALAKFAEAPVPRTWKKADELLDLVSREKIAPWYALILPLFAHPDLAVRNRAVEELGRRELRRYAAAVVPLLKDPEIRVSWQAAFTLIQMEARERVPEIAPLLKTAEGSVRLNVLHVLGRLGSQEHGPLLAPLLDDPDQAIQLAAIQVLGRFKAREYSGRVARFLESAEPVLRQEAIASLAGMNARDTAGKIAERLSDAEVLVRWEAIRALGKLKAKEHAGAIVSMGDEDGAQAPLLEAMGELGLRELAPHILPMLDIPDPGIRWRAVKALGSVDARDDANRMAALLKDEDNYVRRCALRALAAVGTREYAAEMLALLRDEEAEVCECAAEEASLLASPEQLKTVEPLLGDDDPFIRWSALHLLVAANARGALPAIVSRLRSGETTNGDVLWAIGRMEVREQKDRVLEALRSREELVRQQAIFALPRLSDRADELEALERSAQGPTKLAAGFALVRLGRKDRAAASALLKELVVQRDEADYQLFGDEVFDALALGFEKDAAAALAKDVKAEKRVDSVPALRALLAQAGVTLAPEESLELVRRLPAGARVSARRALEWSFGPDARIVPSGGKILVLDPARALEFWQKRLDAP
ncbi:MAG: HEAT repeat domain-containing protein, partial [Planctomycetaceae bacterium]|nr:HEAT repeat domain-containing protein [Planctomycetaceae bacterium]